MHFAFVNGLLRVGAHTCLLHEEGSPLGGAPQNHLAGPHHVLAGFVVALAELQQLVVVL